MGPATLLEPSAADVLDKQTAVGDASSAVNPTDYTNANVLADKPAAFAFVPPAEAEIDLIFTFYRCPAENEHPGKVCGKTVAFTGDRTRRRSLQKPVVLIPRYPAGNM